jgi:hypothetical protein
MGAAHGAPALRYFKRPHRARSHHLTHSDSSSRSSRSTEKGYNPALLPPSSRATRSTSRSTTRLRRGCSTSLISPSVSSVSEPYSRSEPSLFLSRNLRGGRHGRVRPCGRGSRRPRRAVAAVLCPCRSPPAKPSTGSLLPVRGDRADPPYLPCSASLAPKPSHGELLRSHHLRQSQSQGSIVHV